MVYSPLFLASLAFALLFFSVFLSAELDIRHRHDVHLQAEIANEDDAAEVSLHHHHRNPAASEPWLPAFVPLFIFCALVLFAAGTRFYAGVAALRLVGDAVPPAAIPVTPDKTTTGTDDDGPPTPLYTPVRRPRVEIVDAAIDVFLWTVVVLFLVSLIGGLHEVDGVRRPWSAFLLAEIFFYLIYATAMALTIVAIVRTYLQHRYEGHAGCFVGLCGACCASTAHSIAESRAADTRTNQNTMGANERRRAYAEREPYQYNKLAYLCTPQMMHSPRLDLAHVVLLLVHALAILGSAIMLFIRFRQIATQVDAVVDKAEAMAGVSAPAPVGLVWHVDEWPLSDIGRHVLASLVDVRGLVIPLGAVFSPLFASLGLLWLLAIPQAIVYAMERRGLADWLQGWGYWWTITLSILFLALLAARIDNGTLGNASWNNIFAPVYTLLANDVICLVVSALVRRKSVVRGSGSRWGAVIE